LAARSTGCGIESVGHGASNDEETKMQSIDVTHIWMAGVMSVMATFGLIAIVGYLRQRK
jgi:hypothetical protein